MYEDRHSPFLEFCEEGFDIFVAKNNQYGDSISETGVLGAVVEICAKTARLRELVLKNPEHGAQDPNAVHDTALDLHNYANILRIMLNDKNFTGKERD